MSRILYLITIHKKSIVLFTISFLIIFFELFSIHYNYTGTVATIGGQRTVSHVNYPYPYYSDEWVGVSLTEYAIQHHALPMVNPLDANKPFANPLVTFYTFTALIFGILGVSPFTGWAVLALLNGLFICILVYFISRRLGARFFASSVAMLSVPLITNGTNAPGIWFFAPFIGSLTVFLVAILLTLYRKNGYALLAYTFSLMLYPPMILFIAPSIIAMIAESKSNRNNILYAGIGVIVFGTGLVSLIFIEQYGWTQAVNLLTSWIVRPNLDGGIPLLSIWNIIPIPLLIFGCAGIILAVRKKVDTLLLPLFVGFVLWVIYTFVPQTFIMEYSRVVMITSILLMPLVSIGTDMLMRYISKWHLYAEIVIEIAIMTCFCVIGFTYPSLNDWSKLVLPIQTPTGTELVNPANPINQYLTSDDLSLFAGIHENYFVSPPWKGLVIGVATHNYPLESKSSTISNEFLSYNSFISADCSTKDQMASSSGLKYAYSTAFDCPQFNKIGENAPENLILYEYEAK